MIAITNTLSDISTDQMILGRIEREVEKACLVQEPQH